MARKKIFQTQDSSRLSVDLAPPLRKVLADMSVIHGEQTKIVRAAILLFADAEDEARLEAMKRLAEFEQEHGIGRANRSA